MKEVNTNYISFIIPVYNTERYLEECVGSICNQINSGYEIILVDDGSIDNSGKICDDLSAENEKVKVIHQKNKGQSNARNAGLNVSTGKYIAFVDSDDRITNCSIIHLLEWAINSSIDLCFLNAIKFFPDGKKIPLGDGIRREGVYQKSKSEAIHYLSQLPKYPGSACTKLFLRDFLKKNGITFPKDRMMGEDLRFVLECILKAKSFDAIETPYYEYRQNVEGSSSQTSVFWQCTNIITDGLEIIDNAIPESSDIERTDAYSFLAYEFVLLLYMYAKLSGIEQEQANSFIGNYKWLLKYGKTKRIKCISALSNVIGYKKTSKLLLLYMNYR